MSTSDACVMIHLYNPSTDMALASGGDSYTPPKSVAEFERQTALLPSLYASDGDAVLLMCDNPLPLSCGIEPAKVRVLRPRDMSGTTEEFAPWGWNRALRRQMLRAGYPESLMPSEEEIDCWRMLAHRRTSVEINALYGMPEDSMPQVCDSDEAAMEAVRRHGGAVLKMPWSSSGRGILIVRDAADPQAARRMSASICSQGSVIVEKLYDRVIDFATEWESDGSDIRFLGYSMFRTDRRGHYLDNLVASDTRILAEIEAHTGGKSDIRSIPDRLIDPLREVLLHRPAHPYRGLFGVDGLVDSTGMTVPCIEVNLRRTMGHVASDIFRRTGLEMRLSLFPSGR